MLDESNKKNRKVNPNSDKKSKFHQGYYIP